MENMTVGELHRIQIEAERRAILRLATPTIGDCGKSFEYLVELELEALHAKSAKQQDLARARNQGESEVSANRMATPAANTAPAQTPDRHAPVVDASESPAPLKTSEIAGCFDGFHAWDVAQWKSNLQDPAPWLMACRHQAGNQGKPIVESTWWPVQIATALDKKHPKVRRKLHARFKNQEPLKPWFESLETHLPDDSETF